MIVNKGPDADPGTDSANDSGRLLTNVYSLSARVKDYVKEETIPDRLKVVRLTEGLSGEKFAARLVAAGYAVTRTSVYDYEKDEDEKGATVAPAPYVAAVCKEFGWSEAYVLSGIGPRRPLPVEVAALALDRIARIMDALRRGEIPPELYD